VTTTINIGLVGYGFMGKAHSNAYRQAGPFFRPALKPVIKAICGRDETAVKEAADFVNAIARDEMPQPSFADGVRCQAVLEAVSTSVETRRWVAVKKQNR
jgi:predicted dehydrogenase